MLKKYTNKHECFVPLFIFKCHFLCALAVTDLLIKARFYNNYFIEIQQELNVKSSKVVTVLKWATLKNLFPFRI